MAALSINLGIDVMCQLRKSGGARQFRPLAIVRGAVARETEAPLGYLQLAMAYSRKGDLAEAEQARTDAAIAVLNSQLTPFGTSLIEVSGDDEDLATTERDEAHVGVADHEHRAARDRL